MVSKLNDSSEPVELICSVQNYEWGIRGKESLVGQIYEKNCSEDNYKLEKSKPYAEVRTKWLLYKTFIYLFTFILVMDGNSFEWTL